MIPVFIDTREVAAEFALSKREIEGMMSYTIKGVTAEFARQWDNTAKRGLHSLRQLYRGSIVVGEEGPFTGYVMLVNKLPNMIESGASAFDIKQGFMQSPKKKISKSGGWYLTVPFRHASAGALGESEAFSGVMPGSVYAAVKKQESRLTTMGGAVRQGKGLPASQIPAEFAIPRTRAMIVEKNKTFEEYKHKHSIYEGIQRAQKTYQSATQGQYVSFRRASNNSDPNSWIHKGFQARNFAERAMSATNIPTVVDRLVDTYLATLGF